MIKRNDQTIVGDYPTASNYIDDTQARSDRMYSSSKVNSDFVKKEEVHYIYDKTNTSYNTEYVKSFVFKTYKKNGVLIVNIEGLFFYKSGVNVNDVITGLPHINEETSIQISDWVGHTGILRYKTNGTISMIWNYNEDYEITGNVVLVLP